MRVSVHFRILSPPLATSLPFRAGVDAALGAALAVAKIGDVELDDKTRAVTAALLLLMRNSQHVM